MDKKIENFRQLIHFLYGFIIVFLHYNGIINNDSFLFLIIIGIILLLIIKYKPKAFVIGDLLKLLERKTDYEFFPGKGILFFTIGAFLSLYFFEENIAYASILILGVGDSVSNIIGRKFGKNKLTFNKNKSIEGSIGGLIGSIIISIFFVKITPAVIASTIAMIVESLDFKIIGKRIDDNLTIPLISGFILNLF